MAVPITCAASRVRVLRSRGERLHPAFALQRHTAPTARVMVWDVLAYNTWSPLLLIRGTITVQWFVHNILKHVLPPMPRLTAALFLQDNARPHPARVPQDCIRTVTTLPWPAQSTDLSPIEPIWDCLGW
ncbi:transposable element Tcb2 transposase [Trichonephila clavipes]|nr:transposable element Tcb2 transposase [Trichonephila clavipes]